MADEDQQPTPPERDVRSVERLTGTRRPRSVYVVLVIGVLALLSLLLIIYFSSDRDMPETPICTTVSIGQAREAVLEGRISRVTLAYDADVTPPSAPTWGPVLARLDYTDGQCGNLPQGITNQDDIYLLLGAIMVFNDITENTQVEIRYDRETELHPGLFATPTVPPSPTPEPTATPDATPIPETPPAAPASGIDVPVGPVLPPGAPRSTPVT
jgi:hypothetical protein